MDCGRKSNVSNFTRKQPCFLSPKHTSAGGFIVGGQTTEYMKKMSPGVPAGGGDSNPTNGKGKMSSGNIRAFMGLHGRKARDRRRKIAPSKDISTPSQPHRVQFKILAFLLNKHRARIPVLAA